VINYHLIVAAFKNQLYIKPARGQIDIPAAITGFQQAPFVG
jgi:hypothetical protein